MSTFQSRSIIEIAIPAENEINVLHPERVMLKGESSHDLGSLCYLRRADGRREKGQGRMVDIESFSKYRAKSIRKFIERFILQSSMRELSSHTIGARSNVLIRFLDWCDSNGHSSALENEKAGREALRGFCSHLRELYDVHGLAMRSVYTWQQNIINILNQHFEIGNIELGANPIVWDPNQAPRTQRPTNDRLGNFLAFHKELFNGLCDLILEFRKFPYAIVMPEFVGYANNKMWLFPANSGWVRHPNTRSKDNSADRNQAYDYVNGGLKRLEDIVHLYSNKYGAASTLEKTKILISQSNTNERDPARIRMASLALDIFVRLFEAATGANRADIERMKWTDDLANQIANPAVERQGFRSFKVRANNREVHYQIGVVYLPLFRKFVKLRKWILDGSEFDFVFFHYTVKSSASITEGPRLYNRRDIPNLMQACRYIYPAYNEINLGNRKTRAAKQDDVVRRLGPADGAKAMQHGYETAVRVYSNGSDEQATEEIGTFLDKVHISAIRRKRDATEIERGTGRCTDINHPKAIVSDPAVTPDCKTSEGCLFCDKYRVHADDKDVRKLLSAKLLISQTANFAGSAEEYDLVFGATIKRIDRILDDIRSIAPKMSVTIERIQKEVSNGDLDPYWSMKMEQLIEVGIL